MAPPEPEAGARRRRLSFLRFALSSVFGERKRPERRGGNCRVPFPKPSSPTFCPSISSLQSWCNSSCAVLGLILVEGQGKGAKQTKGGAFCSVFFPFFPWGPQRSRTPAPANFFPLFFVAIPRAEWLAFCPLPSHPIPPVALWIDFKARCGLMRSEIINSLLRPRKNIKTSKTKKKGRCSTKGFVSSYIVLFSLSRRISLKCHGRRPTRPRPRISGPTPRPRGALADLPRRTIAFTEVGWFFRGGRGSGIRSAFFVFGRRSAFGSTACAFFRRPWHLQARAPHRRARFKCLLRRRFLEFSLESLDSMCRCRLSEENVGVSPRAL